MTDKVRSNMAKASQVDEVCHELPTMILLSQHYPNHSSTSSQMPSHDHQVAAAGPKQRRRSRKRKEGGADILCRKKRHLTTEQTRLLEMSFGHEHKLASARKDRLAAELGLDPRQVAVWFQNRRARWKSKQLEGEYSRLKASREINMLEKCRLEAEVFKLREQLVEAENKIMSLQSSIGGGDDVGAASAAAAGVAEGERHYSPSTSMSTAETFEQVSFDRHFHDYEDDIFFFIDQNGPDHWPIW